MTALSTRQYSSATNMPGETGRSPPCHGLDISSLIHRSLLDIEFFTKLYLTEVASSECLSAVQSLLSCPSKVAFARSFQENEAQIFIDFLHQVSHSSCFNSVQTHSSCGAKYRSLCKHPLTAIFGGGACGLSARYLKHRGFYPCRTSCKRRTYTLGRFAIRAGLVS